ncbi:hypothetical protein THAOC_34118 [Thalassiosira oceanica]|uniref:Uncharacterized protein n=1 Tax=Thalassiosira oceanica TaxID=159749 RepID=K0R327_THAOC|nr:hypothetical protein THAOC_34118 [Thalassiosira oceanica]|eukprot:EJK47183.1 hypothetical protein THAOC_34118 [Thalassiosira oceanica]
MSDTEEPGGKTGLKPRHLLAPVAMIKDADTNRSHGIVSALPRPSCRATGGLSATQAEPGQQNVQTAPRSDSWHFHQEQVVKLEQVVPSNASESHETRRRKRGLKGQTGSHAWARIDDICQTFIRKRWAGTLSVVALAFRCQNNVC